MIKSFLAAAIMGLGIAGAVFVIHNTRINADSNADSRGSSPSTLLRVNADLRGNNGSTENSNLTSNKPFTEPLRGRGSSGPQESLPDTAQKENLTNYFAKVVGETFTQYNPDGALDLNGQPKINVPDPEKLSEDLLAKAVKNFDPDSLKPVILEKDLNISDDNRPESLTNYFNDFNRVINESATLLSEKTLSATEIDRDQIKELFLMYDIAYKNLKVISVPSNLVKIHQKELELLGAKSAIFSALKNYETDPLLSILASQGLEKIDQEFADLEKEIAEFIKAAKL